MNRARYATSVVALALAMSLAAGALAACTAQPASQSSGSRPASGTAPAAKMAAVRIGVLPNEDSLPLFVAEKQGLFKKAGVDVKLIQFPSAAERDAAFTAGSIDGISADIIATALLTSRGFPARIATLELGATPEQGRFGILAGKNSGITSVAQLAGKGELAQSSGTISTYSADKMLQAAGVDPAKVKRVEVKKLPVRFELLSQGKLAAAVLPEPLLSLGQKQGLKLLADDTTGPNVSQTILAFSDKYLATPEGQAAAEALLGTWDEAVKAINGQPDSFRALLVEKARLPKPIADSYKINEYPLAELPSKQMIEDVLAWMKVNKLLGKPVAFEDLVWSVNE